MSFSIPGRASSIIKYYLKYFRVSLQYLQKPVGSQQEYSYALKGQSGAKRGMLLQLFLLLMVEWLAPSPQDKGAGGGEGNQGGV